MATIDLTTWGISENNTALDNTCIWLDNYPSNVSNGDTLCLSKGIYPFNMIYMRNRDDVIFHGDADDNGDPITVIKFEAITGKVKDCHCENVDPCPEGSVQWNPIQTFLRTGNMSGFELRDLAFDGRKAEKHGGIWIEAGSHNSLLNNIHVRDPFNAGITVGSQSNTNPGNVSNITVEDCNVYGQRNWNGDAKAMFLAGGYADGVTFKICKTYSKSYYKPDTDYSPADHFDSDNGRNIEYHNCVADGEGSSGGVGFWNEAGPQEDHYSSSTYYNCTAFKTNGGLGSAENSDVKAFNFTFKECSGGGWAAWARCCGNFELYDSLFDGCASIGPHGIKRGGFTIEGAPSGKFIKFKRNTFINTPEGSPNYDNINLYSNEAHTGEIEIIDNTFDDNVTANRDSIAENTVSVHWNIFNGSDSDLLKHENDTNYIWNVLKAARTTAINSPTSDATVIVSYGGHSTNVDIPSSATIGNMLTIMEGTINNDSAAKITAEANTTESWLKFKQKSSNSDTTVSIFIDSSEWQNGAPFDDMSPRMQP